jgi:DNA invertase Pin-like site-specific DNA recombinase
LSLDKNLGKRGNFVNVVSYLRVSGKSQVAGDGPERQRDTIVKFVVEHNLTQFDEFFERGVSGTIDAVDRPVFAEMLAVIDERAEGSKTDAACQKIDAIVVERLDRLARDLMVSELLLAECRKRNIKVFAADQGQLIDMAENGGDPTRVLIRQIMGALAQWEKTMLVQKLAKARARIKAKTGRCGGRLPYGIGPNEKPVLEWIKLTWQPGQTLQNVADSLNSAGFRMRNGKQWKRQDAHNLLKHAKGK